MPLAELLDTLSETRKLIDDALERFLPPEDAYPTGIHKAMRYSVFAGGKRLRPALMLWTCELCGGDANLAMPPACALEMIHTYSLIHDDLPAIDDDDLRRGRPTCHKQFDEAAAILAGDALLTHAFIVIVEHVADPSLAKRFIAEIGRASGTGGIIGGQVVDIEASGSNAPARRADAAGTLHYIHTHKTVPPFVAAVRCGAIAADASDADIDALTRYAEDIGLAFQVADDILDVEGTAEELGKTPGKDAAAAKLTYPALFGMAEAKAKARALVESAIHALDRFGQRASLLASLARFIVERKG